MPSAIARRNFLKEWLVIAGPIVAATARLLAAALLFALQAGGAELQLALDPASAGREFEGIGALSAGASSRLLMEYPEPQRSQVLDFLFKPKFGAGFHHLKVEIGGDVNSTDGTEPSHARTREEFEHPRPEYFDRGYEWWLLREARQRNPAILTDILQWGAPGWIGQGQSDSGNFFSQDNADFIVSFIQGARQYHRVEINYCGIWNETPHNVPWIKLLRRALDRSNLSRVQIVASDQTGNDPWRIAKEMAADPELLNAVQVIGAHYVGFNSTTGALATGKRLWSSEDGPWRGDWRGARQLARVFNRNYVLGRMTKTVIWSLVTAYYDTLPLPNSGPMMAKEPWSGHYEVQPATWVIAHTTQFAQPGWKYMDPACVSLPGGGSCVALRSPSAAQDYSVIVETMDAKEPQRLVFRVAGGLGKRPVHVWRSNERSQFDRIDDLPLDSDSFTLTVEPESVYSLTTTTGQQKGHGDSPPSVEFPLPYADDFESSTAGKCARYFSDQGGVFEVCRRTDGAGQALRQTVAGRNIDWPFHPTPEPYSLIGSRNWRNYTVGCDARVETAGKISLWGRVVLSPQSADPAKGYRLSIGTDGHWALKAFTRTLAEGQTEFRPGIWHKLELRFAGRRITGLSDHVELASVDDWTYSRGQAGLGTGWNEALFDNFLVQPLSGPEPPEPVNLAKGAQPTASSQWDDQFSARFAIDGDPQTRWNAAPGKLTNEWVELNFGRPVRFNAVRMAQFMKRITKYQVQYYDGTAWCEALVASHRDEDEWVDAFPSVQSTRMRIVVLEVSGNDARNSTPSLYEIEVYEAQAGEAQKRIGAEAEWFRGLLAFPYTNRLDELPLAPPPSAEARYPFSFTYNGQPSDTLLPVWPIASGSNDLGEGVPTSWRAWTDPATGLRVRFESRCHQGVPDCDWVLYFENTGSRDTPIIENIQALDLALATPLEGDAPYRLHRTKGAPADPTDFEPAIVPLKAGQTERLSAGGGRSSNRDFPFFKVETGEGSLIVAVGWSGQWTAALNSPDRRHLRVTAGQEQTHFILHPGERVRSPRMLLFLHRGDTWEANARFRQLIYRYYAAKRNGHTPLPILFCNTCFTRGGGWLNECNASNQISLIQAYAPLGLEALITDAGWFEGGWPAGAGNWTPRHDAYPLGMAPVAAAAAAHAMIYGLWFEPERVVAGTELHRLHPDWVLTDGRPGQTTLLANFGLRAVQDHFFTIVKGFMALPGFRFYRQDFNMDPLDYWRHNDAPDRQGITEMHYIEGLYAYWDRLAATWPDGLREECASGGRRIDLETLQRMPLHQKSDYWFDNEVDQASLWSLSQYLPNNLVSVPLARLDDYSFRSTLAASLIPAWIADAPGFDLERARKLLDRYRAVRPLLVGAWYPLLPYSRSPRDWMAVQFHRPDLGEGMILLFRHADSPYRTVEVALRGLKAECNYALTFDNSGETQRVRGADLMNHLLLRLDARPGSELILYREIAE